MVKSIIGTRKVFLYTIIVISIITIIVCSSVKYRSVVSEPFYLAESSNKTIFHFYCEHHYGDAIFNLKFFYNISYELKKNNIYIIYYYDKNNTPNLSEFERYVNSDTLSLNEIENKPADAIQLWMGNLVPDPSQPNGKRDHIPIFDRYWDIFYKEILKMMKMEDKGIYTSLFQKEDYLLDIYNKLHNKFHDLDILIINGKPRSGQFEYDKEKMDAMCIRLANKYKIATSSPVNDYIPCTMRDGLKMQDIGAISTHSKNIIAILTGPSTPCFNMYAKNYVNSWYILFNTELLFDELPGKTKTILSSNNLDEINL